MNGGYFEYQQESITEIAEAIKIAVKENYQGFSPETLGELESAVVVLEKARVYAQRVDDLLSGNCNADTFHKRLTSDLLDNQNK
jgi:hypothetical protein